jgi:phosphoenolpyruvate synthase/pyruvate phosphate dikinase
MLGTRGVRLGILYSEIYEMEVHSILCAAQAADEPPHPEIMIPLVDYEHELDIMRQLVTRIGDDKGLTIREHGGDPESIVFFHRAGLDDVSCSPYRVPITRIAAAQASIELPLGRSD